MAYVKTRSGRDVGTAMLKAGLAIARYDSRDGYDWHPKEKKYRAIDARNGQIRCKRRVRPYLSLPATLEDVRPLRLRCLNEVVSPPPDNVPSERSDRRGSSQGVRA